MADRHLALERAQRVLIEDLRNKTLVPYGQNVPAPRRRRYARRLLSPMLECEQRKIREASDVVIGTIDPEDAALVAWSVAMVGVRRHPAASGFSHDRF